MSTLIPIRRALISVSDKTDLIPFARSLVELGVEIISTGGTARAVSEAGIQVIPVEQVTGFPEMMDGRIKTLHPAIHGALLGRRDLDAHMNAMAEHDITPIDLVCINLYPFEQTIVNPEVTPEEAIEQIDIGGPAMLRSAAKNHAFVTVVTGADQYDRVINELKDHDGHTTLDLRRDLAAAAFMRTAQYDTAISAWMCSRREEEFPSLLRLTYAHHSDLRYGENPHQKAVLYSNPASPEPSVITGRVLHGKPLSYNNINDAAAALELIQDLGDVAPDRASAAVLKHTNPCGAATADDLPTAFDLAYAGDPLAAYGGILALSRTVDIETARRICDGQKFLEVIIAPDYHEDALAALGERWKNVRLLAIGALTRSGRRQIQYRSIPGGMLAQERDLKRAIAGNWSHAAGPQLDDVTLAEAAFIWTVVKHVKSNAVAIGRGGQLLGAGAGQMDRVASCRLAVEKAGGRITGDRPAIAASDAFFPFPDGPQVLIDAGVSVIVHPGGSKRDQETFDLCNERNVTCMLTGVRHFRH
ncbi:MAG: bifunctional phosphoribosylaminoimidazolecarboxamide formyltransferase/IMP cyclohydrolase [Phycisphaerales bacterium]|nr:MAG: bifunctional phosphoribosylaminoimidazolecarboxamide formyltransferase/IMP cyclohydrolase [Phycisphaerales bacterium]